MNTSNTKARCCEAMHEDGYCETQPTCPDCGTPLTFRPAGRYGPRRHGFAKKEALWCCPNQRSEGHPKPWLVGWLEWAPEIRSAASAPVLTIADAGLPF